MNIDNEKFDAMSPQEQENLFHKSPFKDKGDLLMRSHEPQHLARSLSEEELYLVTHEMDRQERSEILRYARLSQLFFVSDIDCWKKDRVDTKGFLNWLETLREADEKILLKWLVEMDFETVITGLKKIITITKPEWEYATDEVLGDTPHFTLDTFYYIYVSEENFQTVKRAIELLFENYRGKYTAYMEAILSEIDDELEEEAFKRRESRLAERGFPYPEQAKLIYRPVADAELGEYSNKQDVLELGKAEAGPRVIPNYLTLWSRERLFLDDVFLLFKNDPKIHESLQEELAWLSNKIIACEGIDFSSEERVRHGVERARSFVNIGLEVLSENNLEKAAQIVRETWLELVFRAGVTEILKLREAALEIVHDHWRGETEEWILFLRPPYEFIIRGCLRRIPECFDPELPTDTNPMRDFMRIEEVRRTEISLTQMSVIHQYLHSRHHYKFAANGHDPTTAGEDLFAVLGTLFVTSVVRGKASPQPLSVSEMSRFLEKGFAEKAGRRVLSSEVKDAFLTREFAQGDLQGIRTLWGIIFDHINEEFGRLRADERVQPEFISIALIEKVSVEKNRKNAKKAESFDGDA